MQHLCNNTITSAKTSLWLLMFLCLPSLSVANHILGASMEYENIGKDSFLVRVQVYRNCSDKQLTATPISFRSNCGGASVSAGGEIKTSTDITPFCATACNTCTDKNCSYGFGLQSVTIETIVDFSKYNCCQFTISWEQCCLPYSITTGAAGQNFYTEVFLDKCISANHNSPKFIYDPVSIVALNQCISRSQAAKGDEGDSLVYKLVEPLSAAGTAIPYNENYSREAPLKYAGYPDRDKDFENKNCYGFHFDEQTGELNFKPTQEDVSVIAIEVQQWHKDSTGTYRKIGSTRRQNTITVKDFSGNRSPILADYLSDKKTIRICAGSMLDFKIYSFDSNGDSLKINWTTNISNANISATSSKYPVIDFSWQTSAADARTAPYFLTINANDGACPLPAETQITYKIYVESGIQPKFSLVKKQLDCNTYSFRAMDSSKQQLSYKWYVNEKLVSTDSAFTKAFLQAGKYAIRLNATGSCTSYYLDSVEIKSIPAVTNGSVKQVCLGDTITLQAQQSNKYKWFSSENIIGSDTVSTISVSPTKSAIYYVNITDTQFKCVKKDSVRVIVNNDCVWPGDANKDGIVNHLDILEIGVGFGANGLARTDTSTYWKAQQTTSWNRQTYYGIDYKHLDCDGNGKIDANDTLAVTRNYGKKRSTDFTQPELQNSNHYITFQFGKDTFYAGENVNVYLQTGNTENEDLKVYGFAYNYSLETDKIVNGSFSYRQECIFCQYSTTLQMLRTNSNFSGEAVQVKTDHFTNTINGRLASLSFVLQDSTSTYKPQGEWIYLRLAQTQAVDENGIKYMLNGINDSALVLRSKTNVGFFEKNQSIFGLVHIWPNPAQNQISIQSTKHFFEDVYITNVLGQSVKSLNLPAVTHATINIADLPNGIYFLHIKSGNLRMRHKFIISK